MRPTPQTRRRFLTTAAMTTGALPVAATSRAEPQADGAFQYEVIRTEAEWRARLTPEEFFILREGNTEVPRSSPNWEETRPGNYFCKGCDLHLYSARWKVYLDKGWAFFAHGQPNAILMNIEYDPRFEQTPRLFFTMIKAECRRCGSHLGHIVNIDDKILHCINGTALEFEPADA